MLLQNFNSVPFRVEVGSKTVLLALGDVALKSIWWKNLPEKLG